MIDVVAADCVEKTGNSEESNVFFNKMVADFRRFQSECNVNIQKVKSFNLEADRYYQKAL